MPKKIRKRINIDGKWYKVKRNGSPGAELTHCANTMTYAEVCSYVRSALRRLTMFWLPKSVKKESLRRPYKGKNKRQKWEYPCERCLKWFKGDEVEVDHIIPCGSLSHLNKAGEWLERALVEIDGYQLLCKPCHLLKGEEDRNA